MDSQREIWRNQIIGLGENSHRKSYFPAFKESEEAFKAIFDATYDAIIIHNPEGKILEVNKSTLSLYGLSYQEALTLTIQDITAPGNVYDPVELAKKALAGDQSLLFEWKARRPGDDSTFLVEVTLRSLLWRGALSLVAVVRDITPRVKAQELINRQVKELEMKTEELERFNYTISHDLKGPLITIQGFTGLLLKDLAEGRQDMAADDLKRINKSVNTLNNHLNSLLEFSQMIRSYHALPDTSMEKTLTRALKNLETRFKENNVTVVKTTPLPEGLADPLLMVHVWTHLLENALKFRHPDRPLQIEIGWEVQRQVFWIQDNGLGIDPRFREKVFVLFEKLDPTSPGPGIGLSLVKRIILQHGGRTWAENSDTGMGIRLCFTLG